MDCSPPGSSVHGDSPGKNTGVSFCALLQVIFPTQGLNQVSCIAGRIFTIWATREALEHWSGLFTQSCPILWDPKARSRPDFSVLHHLLEFAQTHVLESALPSNHLVLHRHLLLPSIFPSIWVFSSDPDFCIRWPKYWSFSISPFNEYSGLISFRIDWFDLLAVQGTLKGLLQYQVQRHQFFGTQLSF